MKIKRIGPKFYRGVRAHGLIMGCSVTGTKPKVSTPPLWQAGRLRPHSWCDQCTALAVDLSNRRIV